MPKRKIFSAVLLALGGLVGNNYFGLTGQSEHSWREGHSKSAQRIQ